MSSVALGVGYFNSFLAIAIGIALIVVSQQKVKYDTGKLLTATAKKHHHSSGIVVPKHKQADADTYLSLGIILLIAGFVTAIMLMATPVARKAYY